MSRFCFPHRFFIILVTQILVSINAVAIPAYPYMIRVRAGNGEAFITLHGDENGKYGKTENGYTVLCADDGWYYARKDDFGNVVCSDYRLMPLGQESDSVKMFLSTQKKDLIPHRTTNYASARFNGRKFRLRANNPAVGEFRVLVLLVQFRDVSFKKSHIEFDELFNKVGYREDGAMGSVYDYYEKVSYGKLLLKCDIMGPYTVSNKMSYYGGNSGVGGNDRNPYEMFYEAIQQAGAEINLRDYDADGDGFVDNVHIVYAGYGEESGAAADAIWAHEMSFDPIMLGGMYIDRYSCSPELRGNSGLGISRIGPHCHEIGHALGAMDYYDTDYDIGGAYIGTGDWDIMASGSWNNNGISPANFNPYVKINDFGWTESKELEKNAENEILSSANDGNIYRINTGVNNDYFLLEYRDGQYFDASEPGTGLLIFHVGPKLEERAKNNAINTTYPQQCYVVCASSTEKRPSSSANTYGKINSSGCPFPGSSKKTAFSDDTTPAAWTISGKNTGIYFTGIKLKDNAVTLRYDEGTDKPDAPDDTTVIRNIWNEGFESMKLSTGWYYTDIIGLGAFKVEMKLLGTSTQESPEPAEGRAYGSFQSIVNRTFGRTRTSGSMSYQTISLDNKKQFVLKFQVRCYSKLEDASDSIAVICDTDREKIETCYEVTNSDSWEEKTILLPENVRYIRLEFIPNVENGSKIFLDDIIIAETNVLSVPKSRISVSPGGDFAVGISGQIGISSDIVIINGKKFIFR